MNRGIRFRTLSGFLSTNYSIEIIASIFNVINDLNAFEKLSLFEKRKESLLNKKLSGQNLGGRPKVSDLKESLVIRLRNEGYSYRAIRSQTELALSTIRRIILDSEVS